jgi:hypothetical protein
MLREISLSVLEGRLEYRTDSSGMLKYAYIPSKGASRQQVLAGDDSDRIPKHHFPQKHN